MGGGPTSSRTRASRFRRATALTFTAGALATGAGALTDVPLVYLLARRRFRGRGLVEAIINLPLVIPHAAAGSALLLVFGRRGLLGSAMAPLGVTFTDTVAPAQSSRCCSSA